MNSGPENRYSNAQNNLTAYLDLKPQFSVRIVVCDSYLTKPMPGIDVMYSEFRGTDIKQVPVLRIFGSALDGRKACLHVHGVFPYFYIPCPTSNPEPQFLYQIAVSLDKALNIALKQATSVNQHVYKITLVKGIPFYGFHDKEHLFLKIFLYNPGLIKQAVELCSNGAILGQVLQPHESHLNFTLQFFIDFNLFGMSNIDLHSVKFRKSIILQESDEPFDSPNELSLKSESVCYYEADCFASHIINRLRMNKGDGIENPGLEEVWNQEIMRRKQLNVSMESKTLSQNRVNNGTETHHKFKNGFMAKVCNSDAEHETNIDNVHYPAESHEGSQFFNATDLTTHLEESMNLSINKSFRRESLTIIEADDTIVDEDIALNSSFSLQYSQVALDNEDLALIDLLQDMDRKETIDEDSVMGTPLIDKTQEEFDDDEYSQVFHDETILLESKCEGHSPNWNDSFWDEATIPQLDGTCDDNHVKKVRKRKKLPLKLGLSKSKNKKEFNMKNNKETKSENESEEINESREIVDTVSDKHLKRVTTGVTINNNIKCDTVKTSKERVSQTDHESISSLVSKIDAPTCYDLTNKIVPIPGSSKYSKDVQDNKMFTPLSDSFESSPESNENDIQSFYDQSKIFNLSTDSDTKTKERQKESLGNHNFESEFKHVNRLILTPKIRPPIKKHIVSSVKKYNLPKQKNSEPYFSNHKDVGDKVEIGQCILKVQSRLAQDQKLFEKKFCSTTIEEWRQLLFLQRNDVCEENKKTESLKLLLAGNSNCIIQPVKKPPTKREVEKWCNNKVKEDSVSNTVDIKEITINVDDIEASQGIGLKENDLISSLTLEEKKPNLENSFQVTMQTDGSYLCFGSTESQVIDTNTNMSPVEVDFLTVMVLEVHTEIRGELCPDPEFDSIKAIFISVKNDCPDNHFLVKHLHRILVVDDQEPPKYLDRCIFMNDRDLFKIEYVNTEIEILDKLISIVKENDPDIMCGYEIEMNSWGYVLERAQHLGVEIVQQISRITEKYRQKRWRHDDNEMEGRIIGRITFNVWKLFRYELALSSYSFENCMYEILKERVPKYSFAHLSNWWNDKSRILRWIPVEYYMTKLSGTVRMLEKLDIINRTSELARLFGLQWWEVLSRGSQFRVESLMLRAARPLNLVALSPTIKQRAAMRAPECLPLIFEPESRFYADPVIVLDFQSLYPSMMIAYNYCFSTCIGRIQNINCNTPYEFGAWRLRVSKSKLQELAQKDLINWSPVGVGFVKPDVRRGVLPSLLRRILAARQAVKKGMKLQTDENVKKAMHSRQLGLKLIANVTYGYTAANFSGRMPCVEVGDSVVAKGRETLERAIKLVKNGSWNAKVIYGDTDSMFVLVPGGSRAEAFAIGQQIADAVTADNPSPVALKLEKVYQPCILQTKKRYVGYMYESLEQEKPIYEAKGIETVRRDGCPASVKLLQRSLCELFETGDVSRVKQLVCKVLSKLADGSLPPHELFFTREFHGLSGYRPTAAAPPNEIAKRLISRDRRSAPRVSERVSWLVCAGAPGTPLVKLARTPTEIQRDTSLVPHVSYYAARSLLPPLHRCLSLLGVDVFKWWNEVGWTREVHFERGDGVADGIARYMQRGRCAVCGAKGARALCASCVTNTRVATSVLRTKNLRTETHISNSYQVCYSCCGHKEFLQCENTECLVLWRRIKAQQKYNQLQDVMSNLPEIFYENHVQF
ncbi:unnamed protein product [Leptosia nina]|uniref:DNA polymerase n=1 Tax=Leptosia nina TaxID=320188 RepID=A0AAV1JBL0_9NEOP